MDHRSQETINRMVTGADGFKHAFFIRSAVDYKAGATGEDASAAAGTAGGGGPSAGRKALTPISGVWGKVKRAMRGAFA